MKEIRKYRNEDIITAIENIEYLRVNFARIGRMEVKNQDDLDKFLLIQNLFLAESNLHRKLTDTWRVLIDNYQGKEEEELDDLLEQKIEDWNIPYDLSKMEIKKKLDELLNE